MGYIEKEVTETLTRIKNVGMTCDVCGNKTDTVDDKEWHVFDYRKWHDYDGEGGEWVTVCSPKCLFDKIKEAAKVIEDEGALGEFEPKFLKKLAQYDIIETSKQEELFKITNELIESGVPKDRAIDIVNSVYQTGKNSK